MLAPTTLPQDMPHSNAELNEQSSQINKQSPSCAHDIIDDTVDKAVSGAPDAIEDPTDAKTISGEVSLLPVHLSDIPKECPNASTQAATPPELPADAHTPPINLDAGIQSARGKRFRCDECDKTYTTKHRLKSHTNKAHTAADKQVKYSCKDCEYKTYYQSNLPRHRKKHNVSSSAPKSQKCQCTPPGL
ncbi:hypothetical protein HYPSUDRAFT_69087 [Hypholoma sublateritium FD-334 SS-4]|uniref:C2H2-type domain-containing protein n=1 Tax=Hypholoma sublateritium (strain FD-334 SS-4) TaxID=945553 RepID=A0A0D2M8W9_HYPSF|nr:hypothetical protein HYPSUDRAFT_69087 [Hypholoma sublateritium FD-334 SS-4]